MSDSTYPRLVHPFPEPDRPLKWLHGQIRTPPFTRNARIEAGFLLRQIQDGFSVGLPRSRPMPAIGARCHELRITDAEANWRIVYRIDPDAILILHVFKKQTQSTPDHVLKACRSRIRNYDADRERP
ncbi:MAG: hypothetical protein RL354_453 [Planctomycetota bacterium]|jgi:phage-related protein